MYHLRFFSLIKENTFVSTRCYDFEVLRNFFDGFCYTQYNMYPFYYAIGSDMK
jgi:hypothetical protein